MSKSPAPVFIKIAASLSCNSLVTFAQATETPLRDLPDRDLWPAVKAIGAHKLSLRQGRITAKVLDVLRPLNARIDSLLIEEESRRIAGAEARRATTKTPRGTLTPGPCGHLARNNLRRNDLTFASRTTGLLIGCAMAPRTPARSPLHTPPR